MFVRKKKYKELQNECFYYKAQAEHQRARADIAESERDYFKEKCDSEILKRVKLIRRIERMKKGLPS